MLRSLWPAANAASYIALNASAAPVHMTPPHLTFFFILSVSLPLPTFSTSLGRVIFATGWVPLFLFKMLIILLDLTLYYSNRFFARKNLAPHFTGGPRSSLLSVSVIFIIPHPPSVHLTSWKYYTTLLIEKATCSPLGFTPSSTSAVLTELKFLFFSSHSKNAFSSCSPQPG